MSIIYEALKKVEAAHKEGNLKIVFPPPKPSLSGRARPNKYLVYALIVCAALFIVNTVFYYFVNSQTHLAAVSKETPVTNPGAQKTLVQPPSSSSATLAVVSEPKKEPEPPVLTLNGIFYAQDDSYALINNRIVRIGDEIEGAVVKRIDPEEVELEAGGSVIKLSSRKR